MSHDLRVLENEYWQAGILPTTGASISFGRVHRNGQWLDVMRPTSESDYGNSSHCSSFIMLPWCNRIKSGLLRLNDKEYPLRTTKDDGTARHGDVRGRVWRVDEATSTLIRMSFYSGDFADINWPFRFSARAEYCLDGRAFIWTLTLRNEDEQPMPGGFGHHPYFVRSEGVQVQIPCSHYFQLTHFMATTAPVPLVPALDFRALRPLPEAEVNDLLTQRSLHESAQMFFPHEGVQLEMQADDLFEHILIYAPQGKPFFAVEPMTNASDGFNLYAQGIPGSGVWVLQPGEERSATARLVVNI